MSKKLLLADDSITIQKVIGITFANEDFDLTIVDNGEAALRKALDERPDLILADIFMPGKDGYELCTAVKQEPSLAGVPVLLLTGTFEPFDEVRAREAGADNWIAKPFESQALINRVEELLAAAPEAPAAPETLSAASETAPAAPEETPPPPAQPAPATAAPPPSGEWEETFDLEGGEEDEGLWGAVSLDEEELGESAPEASATGEENVSVFEEEPFALQEEASLDPPSESAVPKDEFAFEDEPFDFGEEPAEGVVASGEVEEGSGFDEEPLSLEDEPSVEAPEPEPEIFSADIAEDEDFSFEEEEPAPQPEPFAPLADEEISDEDILTLDEVDILEEEELDPLPETPSGEMPLEETEPLQPSEPDAPLAEEDIWGEAAAGLAEEPAEDDFSLIGEHPEWGDDDLEEAASSQAPEAPSAPKPATPGSAAVQAAAAEEKVRALSDEELAEVVEKVAGEVIERLANTVLEKIAWEVVPDLAESLIKDEIRKIKEGAA